MKEAELSAHTRADLSNSCIDLTIQINFSLDLQALLSLSHWGNSELAETSPVPCYTAAENKLEISKWTGNLAGMENLRPEFQESSF